MAHLAQPSPLPFWAWGGGSSPCISHDTPPPSSSSQWRTRLLPILYFYYGQTMISKTVQGTPNRGCGCSSRALA